MPKILEKIFSIKNDKSYKIITIAGLKFKFDFKRLQTRVLSHFLKIDKNKIVFSNYFGKSYGCNPKYITEEILKRGLPYKLVWLVNDVEQVKQDFPDGIKLVNYDSYEAMKELLTSKLWVDNTRKNPLWRDGLVKRQGQKYIQTWHGSLGIKKIEGAIEDENFLWRKWAKVDSRNIDFLLSNSTFEDGIYGRDFWYSGNIVKTGHPRLDIFFKKDDELQDLKAKIYQKYNIQTDKKLVLYVPTFRDDGDLSCLNLDTKFILNALREKYNTDFVFGIHLHPYVTDKDIFNYGEDTINMSDYPDIMELLTVSDIIITDYSSCVFDFML